MPFLRSLVFLVPAVLLVATCYHIRMKSAGVACRPRDRDSAAALQRSRRNATEPAHDPLMVRPAIIRHGALHFIGYPTCEISASGCRR